MSAEHTKKVFARYFSKILSGEKTYEVRLADWQREEGDILHLVEIDDESKQPTGREMRKRVGAVIRTKDIESLGWWSERDVRDYGFQVIALKDEVIG